MKNTLWIYLALISSAVLGQPPLTVGKCRELALRQNEQIQIADADVRAAQSRQEVAKLGGLPTVSGGVTGFILGKPLTELLPQYGASASVGVSQPIYNGDKLRNSYRQAEVEVRSRQTQQQLQRTTLLMETDRAYWQVVAAQEKITLTDASRNALLGLLRELETQLRAGLIDKNDVLRVQVRLNEAEANRLRVQNELALARLTLAQLTGLNDPSAVVVPDSVPEPVTHGQSGDYTAQALLTRPEIALQQQAVQAEELAAKIRQADFIPQIGVSANALYNVNKAPTQSDATGSGADPMAGSFLNRPQFGTWYGLLNVSIPVFHWGERQKVQNEYRQRIRSQQLRVQVAQKQVALEVQEASFRLTEASRKIELSTLSVAQATENLRLLTNKFRAGILTGKDVLDGQLLLQQARTDLIDAKIDYKLRETTFQKATGNL